MTEYNLVRSQRKTLAIYITENATVEVRAPLKMPKSDIDRFVLTKQKWIAKHLSNREIQNKQKVDFVLNYGDMVAFRGERYPIKAKAGTRAGFDDVSFFMPEDLNHREIKYAVIQIYKMLARNILTNKVVDFAKQMGVSPSAVRINSATTRWGSCSGKNSINFSWRLILADDNVIDYVVVHELAHIKQHNHSAKFWRVVESVLPDYKLRQKGLKTLQKRLCGEDWE